MDITTYETAKRLKEAGFPQPEYIGFGFGYDETGSRFLIQECSFPLGGVDGMYYAPTAADILREIDSVTLYWDIRRAEFSCSGGDSGKFIGWIETKHANPAEAAASAWLAIRAK